MIFSRSIKFINTLKMFCCAAVMLGIISAASENAFAAGWVSPGSDTVAEAAIVMDADSKTVLWGKNIDEQCYPASITKLMTGLLVMENCKLNEKVTVTAEAVSNLESGAVSVGLAEGDELTVEELLYAMLLRSANDAANVLAVHVSGSIDAFAEKMTQRAAELGCKNTVFRNPSGLTSPENVTTAYDMALIGAACAERPEFIEIEKHQSYKISPTSKYPDGFTVNAEHKMLVNGTAYKDERVIGGKTGFIKASGNTLVTIAEQDGKRLVAVVLKDKNPDHYRDTKMLLDFGFDNFDNFIIQDPAAKYNASERLEADKIVEKGRSNIVSSGDAVVTLPKGSDPEEVKADFDYNLPAGAPENTAAVMVFRYDGVRVGSTYILNDYEADVAIDINSRDPDAAPAAEIPLRAVITVLAAVLVLAAAVLLIVFAAGRRNKEKARREKVIERRRQRLKEDNISEDEFRKMVEKRRNRTDDSDTAGS